MAARAAANTGRWGGGVGGGWGRRPTGEGVLGGTGRGASPDASRKLIIRVIYTGEFWLQTQFLLMQACPLFRVGVYAGPHVCGGAGGAGGQVCVPEARAWALCTPTPESLGLLSTSPAPLATKPGGERGCLISSRPWGRYPKDPPDGEGGRVPVGDGEDP